MCLGHEQWKKQSQAMRACVKMFSFDRVFAKGLSFFVCRISSLSFKPDNSPDVMHVLMHLELFLHRVNGSLLSICGHDHEIIV